MEGRWKAEMKATLALENGSWYEGQSAGAAGQTGGDANRRELDLRKSSNGEKLERDDADQRDADRQQGRGDRTLNERRRNVHTVPDVSAGVCDGVGPALNLRAKRSKAR